jgi:hypothetical protein
MIAAAALTVATPASAQVTLSSGQGTSVTIGSDGKVEMGKVHPAALGPHDLEALDQMRISYKTAKVKSGVMPPVMMRATEATMPDVAPGRVEIVFVVIGEKDSVLVMLNGYDQGLTYRATIFVKGRSGPTDVCLVMPGRRGYEHWPYAIDRIELTAFQFEDWKPGNPVPCK